MTSQANVVHVLAEDITADKLCKSAGLSSDLTLRSVMTLLLTSSCVKRCRSSMRFAFFDAPSLPAIEFAALLSVCILMLARTSNASFMKLLM